MKNENVMLITSQIKSRMVFSPNTPRLHKRLMASTFDIMSYIFTYYMGKSLGIYANATTRLYIEAS